MKDPGRTLEELLAEGRDVQARFFQTERDRILSVAATIAKRLRRGGKLLLFGNGGSAADAQHLAAEFVGRFGPERPALPAISLAADASTVTALANDYGFERVFARQIEAFGRPEDIAVGISTSGRSRNVLLGLEAARSLGLATIGLTGESGGEMPGLADEIFRVPSTRTARIQETHIILGHLLAELIDRDLHAAAYDD